MSIDQTTSSTSTRLRAKRPAMFITAGLVAAALAVSGGPLAANAASDPAVTPSTTTASARGQIALTGSGFDPSESVAVTLDSAPAETYPETVFADGDGAFEGGPVNVYLPDDITSGPHTITVTGADSNVPVVTNITVVDQPTITTSSAKLTVSEIRSTGITATVHGFAPGTKVQFGIGGGNMGDIDGAPVVVGPDGTATHTYAFAAGDAFSGAGAYTLSATSLDFGVVSQWASYTVVADPAAETPATPATPITTNASFTG